MQKVLELIERIEAEPGRSRELLEGFVRDHPIPLLEGDEATFFAWDGNPADAVFLQHWAFGLPSRVEFRRIPGTDAFFLPLDLPKGGRFEYKLEVVRGGTGEWTADPRNPRRAHDPFGSNSVCPASSYHEPEWTIENPAARKGTIVDGSLRSRALRGDRRVRAYVPHGSRPGKRYPLLVVHDGDDFLSYGDMRIVLDNLIHAHEIAPMVVAFTSGARRNHEYACNDAHARFLVRELLPYLERHFPLLPGPESRGVMGASFGAVASLHAATRYPGVFGRLCLLSGSFAFTDIGDHERGPAWDPIVTFVNEFRHAPPKLGARIFQACGTFEGLIYFNRSFYPTLSKAAEAVRFREVPDGHNWINWRDRLREGLAWLFPGPLWMYYE